MTLVSTISINKNYFKKSRIYFSNQNIEGQKIFDRKLQLRKRNHFNEKLIAILTMRIGVLRRIHLYFSTQKSIFASFLESNKKELSFKRNTGRNGLGSQIHVPCKQVTRQSVQAFFQQKGIISKSILVNVDPSHLIGTKRLLSLQYLKKNVYKGLAEPVDILSKKNPSAFINHEEIRFDTTIFAITDPIFLHKAEKQGLKVADLLPQIQQYYRKNPQRGVQRLQKEFKIPKEFLYIIQTASNLQNQIFFVGLNEYELRSIVNSYLKIEEVKILFMESLKYCRKQKTIQGNSFHQSCKKTLWLMHYHFLQPINQQLILKLRKQVKGYCFSQHFNFLAPQNSSINFKDLRDKDNDNVKLQKHAILQVLFGSLWSRPYTNNPFPYLTESYDSLSKEDKELVVETFNIHYKKYKAAKDSYLSSILN